MAAPKDQGQWEPKFQLENVAVHLHLLPTGKVLYWGRRDNPGNMEFKSLNQHYTKTYILDTTTGKSTPTASTPRDANGEVNLFCSGHAFQTDGTLLVLGGHILDGRGLDQACVYDPFNDTWTPKPTMEGGRWYPSALTLPDGDVLVVSGSTAGDHTNIVSQIYRESSWRSIQSSSDIFSLYPRLYHDPSGKVFMAGPLAQSRFLDRSANNGIGAWSGNDPQLVRAAGQREYAASATYDSGKIIYISGGGGEELPPTNIVELIDLNDAKPTWKKATDIGLARRHHFATVLPDGTVLVTGGTKGIGFNDVNPGQPVHKPELWDPATGQWTFMAEEDDDRCYHHTALLLPDGRVLSAGSGEYDPGNQRKPNPAKDSITTGQMFHPPYLFKGDRPTITKHVSEINYSQKFSITVGANDVVGKVSWVRIGSVTHACNMNQSFTFLEFKQDGAEVTITAPSNHNLVPAGHYMLFVLNKDGVPAVAPIILLKPGAVAIASEPEAAMEESAPAEPYVAVTLEERNHKVISEQDKPPVVVGLTPACPYGLGPCWGGAFEALQNISDADVIRPLPNHKDSVAYVYLKDDILPDIDVWRKQVRELDSGTYVIRGIEMTLTGAVTSTQVGGEQQLTLAGSESRSKLILAPLQEGSKVQWDRLTRACKPMSEDEADAYKRLSKTLEEHPSVVTVKVTGPLQKDEDGKYSLQVREFEVETAPTAS